MELQRKYVDANTSKDERNNKERITCWIRPLHGWYKMNCDIVEVKYVGCALRVVIQNKKRVRLCNQDQRK